MVASGGAAANRDAAGDSLVVDAAAVWAPNMLKAGDMASESARRDRADTANSASAPSKSSASAAGDSDEGESDSANSGLLVAPLRRI
jgi:hypothetical protein